MHPDTCLAFSILESLDIAVLRRTGPETYAFFGTVPEFYRRLFTDKTGVPSASPWLQSDMLAFFLPEVEAFFSAAEPEIWYSDVWQEHGVEDDCALQATALRRAGEQFLIVRYVRKEFADRVRVLQKARKELLRRRALATDIEQLKQKAYVDSLTMLHNYGFFVIALPELLRRAEHESTKFSLLLMDIDEFKGVNDTYGHLAGDSVLAAFGRLLHESLRHDDIAVRYGGDEFVILTPSLSREQAASMAESLQRRVASHNFAPVPSITLSIGCTEHIPGDTQDSLIQRADAALYDAKRKGKNTVCIR